MAAKHRTSRFQILFTTLPFCGGDWGIEAILAHGFCCFSRKMRRDSIKARKRLLPFLPSPPPPSPPHQPRTAFYRSFSSSEADHHTFKSILSPSTSLRGTQFLLLNTERVPVGLLLLKARVRRRLLSSVLE